VIATITFIIDAAKIQVISVFGNKNQENFCIKFIFMNMTASEKIEKLLIYLNINAKAFSEKLGYSRAQIIYDIQKGKTKAISDELASKIVSVFSDISKSCLLADEGDMIRSNITQNTTGDNNTQIAGNGNTINISSTLDKAINEISEMRKALTDALHINQDALRVNQENTARLFSIIEKMISSHN